ncbi:MAG: hypothetical protein PQJ58_02580 [Spirochaetales bacterium]|nr:hypothetical protein [Spirochaetales bacterium]
MRNIKKQLFNFRHLSLPAVMFLLVMNLFGADGFYENYSDSERLVIAGAYLAVSEQYGEIGEKDKAQAYRDMAELIFPGIETQEIESPAALTPAEAEQVQTAAPARPGGKEPAAVNYFLSKMLRAVFSENAGDIDSLLSTRIYLPGYDQGVKKAEAMEYVQYAFDTYELDRMNPGMIYDLKRVYIKPEGSSWIGGIDLTPEGQSLFEKETGLKGSRHLFYFREFREGWRLIAINAVTVDNPEDF